MRANGFGACRLDFIERRQQGGDGLLRGQVGGIDGVAGEADVVGAALGEAGLRGVGV